MKLAALTAALGFACAAAISMAADTGTAPQTDAQKAQANAPRLFAHFDEVDTNKDGFITPDEMKAARAKRQAAAATQK